MKDSSPLSHSAPTFVAEELKQLDIEMSDAELAAMSSYLDLLLDANERFNLTGIKDRDQAWRRHIIDSMTVMPAISGLEDGEMVADVGSGGGLPGIPLAIAMPRLRFTLIETTGKKARFLEECVATLGLGNVSVVNDRAERLGQNRSHREKYMAAVCRAVGPMRELLEYTLPLVAVGGVLAAIKGPSVEQELRDAADALDLLGAGELQVVDAYPESFGIETVIVVIAKDRPTPKGYPRSPGTPRQMPL